MRPLNIAILASGNGTTARSILESSGRDPGYVVRLIISNSSKTAISSVAREYGTPFVHLSSVTHPDPTLLDAAMCDVLCKERIDLVVLAGYMKKIGERTLRVYAGSILNTHPALLPAFGGQGMYGDRVHLAVLRAGVKWSGASVHWVTSEYDEGPVLAQREVEVRQDDVLESLRERVQAAEKSLLVDVLHELAGSRSRMTSFPPNPESTTA